MLYMRIDITGIGTSCELATSTVIKTGHNKTEIINVVGTGVSLHNIDKCANENIFWLK